MRFTKMHGAGNDYVYINCFDTVIADAAELARKISDRHFGVGSDGLVLILPSDVADFRMRMFNSDGSEAEMCGNASRCVAKYVYDNALTDKFAVTLETGAGVLTLHIQVDANNKVSLVTVDMGEPILQPSLVPVALEGASAVATPIDVADMHYEMTCVSMGNPHAVIFKDSPITDTDIHHYGKMIEVHPLFPRRTNVEFVQVLSPTELSMRVWERGAGETLACGTGACATLVAAVLNGKAARKATIELLGGSLEIEWRESNNHVYMTGGAVVVFEGDYLDV